MILDNLRFFVQNAHLKSAVIVGVDVRVKGLTARSVELKFVVFDLNNPSSN